MDERNSLDVKNWLSALGMSQYLQSFIDNDVDDEILPSLTVDDLRELGIMSIGHRRRIMVAIGQLSANLEGDGTSHEPAQSVKIPSAQPAERRNLTVMFCDLMDSTKLSVDIDPEDFREYIASYRQILNETVKPFDGHIAQYVGDGVFIYFGYPRSVEHDAENALAASLEILSTFATTDQFGDQKPNVRMGIATGLTVVGAIDDHSKVLGDSAVGETPNLAARMQSLAGENKIVMASRTRKLVGELFDCTDMGTFELKGFEKPVRAWQLDGRSNTNVRFHALRAGQPATKFVGRKIEMTGLRKQLAGAKSGHGQFAVIVGDGGFGKSRLARQIADEAGGKKSNQVIFQCTPYNVGSAFHPFRYYIETLSGLTTDEEVEIALEKLTATLSRLGPVTDERLALIAELTRVRGADLTSILALSSHERRNRTMEFLLELLVSVAGEAMTITLEDIQWIDPSSAELIEHLLEKLDSLPVLIIATMRPQPYPLWLTNSQARFIELERLKNKEIEHLISAAAQAVKIPPAVMDVIVSRSDGIAIFAEELTRGYVDAATQGRDGDDELAGIPDSLSDSLLARLDRLNIGRRLALIAAVIGHQFPIAVLVAVSELPDSQAREGVQELLDANVLIEGNSRFGQAISFGHMLMREAAYKLLLRRDRIILHKQVADVLVQQFPDLAEVVPHVIATHLEQAGEYPEASKQWERAGDQSARNSAYDEAITYYNKALYTNEQCEETNFRDENELSFRLSLASVLIASRGYAAGGVNTEIDRAVLLSKKTGTTAKLIPAMTAKWVILGAQDHNASFVLALQMWEIAKNGSDIDKLFAHRVMGTTQIFGGQFLKAIEQFESFFALYDFDTHEEALSVVGPSNHAIMMRVGLSEVYTFFEEFDKAEHWSSQALEAAEKNGQMHDICHVVLFSGCLLACLRGQDDFLFEYATRLRTLSQDNNLPFWRGHADLFCGIWNIRQGKVEAGFKEARRGINGLITSNAFNMCWFTLYADYCVQYGRYDEAEENLALVKPGIDSGEQWMMSEYHRIRALLMFYRDGALRKAKAELQIAIDIAVEQGANLFAKRGRNDLKEITANPDWCETEQGNRSNSQS